MSTAHRPAVWAIFDRFPILCSRSTHCRWDAGCRLLIDTLIHRAARVIGPSWGQRGAHLCPGGPRWAPRWPHKPCYLGTFTACLRSRNPDIWHQARAVPGNTAVQSITLNGCNNIIIHNHKVICEAFHGVLKLFYFLGLFFIDSCKLGFV